MRFRAFAEGREVATRIYYSTGGGFILRDGQIRDPRPLKPVPRAFSSADELLHIGHEHAKATWQIALENEKAWLAKRKFAPMCAAFGM